MTAIAWSYSGDPSTSPADALRFTIGDTQSTDPLLSDGEVAYLLQQSEGNVPLAAIAGLNSIILAYSRAVDETVGSVSLSFSQRLGNLQKAQGMVRDQFVRQGGWAPYVGGLSVSEKVMARRDRDLVQPCFTVHDCNGRYGGPYSGCSVISSSAGGSVPGGTTPSVPSPSLVGTPSSGDFSAAFGSILSSTRIADAFQIIANQVQVLTNLGGGGGSGASLLSGIGPPAANIGVVGSVYLDTQHGYLYPAKTSQGWSTQYLSLVGPAGQAGASGAQGAAGQTGAAGAPGAPGASGNAVLSGTGVPSDANTGRQNDFYIDVSDYHIFGPKGASTWGAPVSLIGPQGAPGASGAPGTPGAAGAQGAAGTPGAQGAPGSSVDSAARNPTAADGNNGDAWLNVATGVLFGPKANGAWPNSGLSLVGPQGPAGSGGGGGNELRYGSTDPTSSSPSGAIDGDFYIQIASHTLFGPRNGGSWPAGTSLVGPSGASGSAGASGTNGKTVITGTTNPTSGVGTDGDSYLNTQSSTLFSPKASGAWPTGVSLVGPQGAQGPSGAAGQPGATGASGSAGTPGSAGADGKTLRSGSGAPADSLGQDGDFYIDTASAAYNIYGPRTSGHYGTPTPLVGPSGQAGTTGSQGVPGTPGAAGTNGYAVQHGSGAPSGALGQINDFYIDTSAWTIQLKTAASTWSATTSLIGPSGAAGATGTPGAAGAAGTPGSKIYSGSGAPDNGTGSDGDYYFRTDTGSMLGPKVSGAWPGSGTSLVGPSGTQGTQGAQGTAGTNGTNGNTVLYGSGAPSNGLGVAGNFYIDTVANFLYGPKGASAWPTGTSLVGPAGAAGGTGSVTVLTTTAPTLSTANNGYTFVLTSNTSLGITLPTQDANAYTYHFVHQAGGGGATVYLSDTSGQIRAPGMNSNVGGSGGGIYEATIGCWYTLQRGPSTTLWYLTRYSVPSANCYTLN